MISRRVFLYRLYVVFNISLIWVVFSIIFLYNIVGVEKEILVERRLSFFSLAFALIGFIIVSAEAFFLKNAFHKYPFWLSIIMRMSLTFLLFICISVFFLLAYYIIRYDGSFRDFTSVFFNDILMTPSFLMFMIDLGLLAFISIILLEITDKYGPGGFTNMLRGRYNKPRIENRIFIFLDINESTTIAEHLGHEKYFTMLKEFFADITEPILANGASIYQYVGDEVVLSWKTNPENKQRCLKFIRQSYFIMKRKSKKYLKQYGYAPSFKTGVHAGEVTAGYIGIIKKDLVYSGDTLNTTARIRSKCHDLNHAFLLSETFLQDFEIPFSYTITDIGEMEFKGREEKEKLFALEFD